MTITEQFKPKNDFCVRGTETEIKLFKKIAEGIGWKANPSISDSHTFDVMFQAIYKEFQNWSTNKKFDVEFVKISTNDGWERALFLASEQVETIPKFLKCTNSILDGAFIENKFYKIISDYIVSEKGFVDAIYKDFALNFTTATEFDYVEQEAWESRKHFAAKVDTEELNKAREKSIYEKERLLKEVILKYGNNTGSGFENIRWNEEKSKIICNNIKTKDRWSYSEIDSTWYLDDTKQSDKIKSFVSDAEQNIVKEIPLTGRLYTNNINDFIDKAQRPPLGLTPKCIYLQYRLQDIKDALTRYAVARKEIPVEWIDEYNEIDEYLETLQF